MNTNPSFNQFVTQYSEDIAAWSIDNCDMESSTLHGIWKRRFALAVKNNSRILRSTACDIKIDKKKWNLIKKLSADMAKARLSYRQKAMKSLCVAPFSAARLINNALQLPEEQQVYLESRGEPEHQNHQHQENPLTNAEIERFLYSAADKKLSGISLDGKGKELLTRINKHNNLKSSLMSLAAKILKKRELTAIDESIVKLSLSSVVNFINPSIKKVIMDQVRPSLEMQCLDYSTGASGLDDESSNMFDKVMELGDGSDDTDAMLSYILITKGDLVAQKRKQSQVYKMLSVLEQVIENFGLWHNDNHESEITFYRRFASLLDIIFRGTQIELADGETGCSSTRYAIEMNNAVFQTSDASSTYSRKIDLLMKFDGGEVVKLSSNEWKNSTVSSDMKIKQQCKNLRINTAILSSMNCTFDNGFNKLMAMDWIGNVGYLYILKRHDGVLISSLVEKMMIPKEAAYLVNMKATMNALFVYKNFMANICSLLRAKLYDRAMDKQLSDITDHSPTNSSSSEFPFVFFMPKSERAKKRRLDDLDE